MGVPTYTLLSKTDETQRKRITKASGGGGSTFTGTSIKLLSRNKRITLLKESLKAEDWISIFKRFTGNKTC